MPLHADLADLALRLGSAFLASLVIGLDRELHERAAGMRTTILVCLAACIAMISANLLLDTTGKDAAAFAQIDVLRLPLGILTGMGFIGAGAIMRRDDGFVLGVTTAATLWFVTVMGLCFGAGQFALGGAAWLSAVVVLWLLKHLEARIGQDRAAKLVIMLNRDGPSEADVRAHMDPCTFRVRRLFVRHEPTSGRRELRYELWYRSGQSRGEAPPLVATLAACRGVEQVDWDS